MFIESCADLKPFNTFGVHAKTPALIHIYEPADIAQLLLCTELMQLDKMVLGGGSNVLLTQDLHAIVLKIEIKGKRLLETKNDAWIIEVGAGEIWHDVVEWSLAHGWPGLENLALIPGTAGAAPVQNIGAYGIELADRFDSLDAIDLSTGQLFSLNKEECQFGYRHSVFKDGLANKAIVARIRLRLPKPWQPVIAYRDIMLAMERDQANPVLNARYIFELVCQIRKNKLPDPAVIGNAGSFFKNPIVSAKQCQKILAQDSSVVFYELTDGQFKLAAGWLIDACGWRGKSIGQAGVYDKQALVLVNKGNAHGSEILTLAKAIQQSVYGRFGIMLEPEPLII